MAMLQRPTLIGRDILDSAVQTSFANTSLAVVRDAIAASLAHFEAPDWLDRVVSEVPDTFKNLVQELAMANLPERTEKDVARYVREITIVLIDKDLLRLKAELLGRLRRADANDTEMYRTLQRELVRVEAERRALREE